jgi:hypothetical protein
MPNNNIPICGEEIGKITALSVCHEVRRISAVKAILEMCEGKKSRTSAQLTKPFETGETPSI